MHWGNIDSKLKLGVALVDRNNQVMNANKFNSEIEQIAYTSARKTGQFDGFGQQAGIVEQLQSGEIIPDDIYGWSTKTVLVALLLLMLFKVKKMQGSKK